MASFTAPPLLPIPVKRKLYDAKSFFVGFGVFSLPLLRLGVFDEGVLADCDVERRLLTRVLDATDVDSPAPLDEGRLLRPLPFGQMPRFASSKIFRQRPHPPFENLHLEHPSVGNGRFASASSPPGSLGGGTTNVVVAFAVGGAGRLVRARGRTSPPSFSNWLNSTMKSPS
jgi:hypothetical protein